MSAKQVNVPVLALLAVLVGSPPVLGQGPLGVRAAGMGGAFVGVADDASAVYWNPAGLATGAIASFVFDYGIEEAFTDASEPSKAGQRQTVGVIALALPPLGLTYYRMGEYSASPQEAAVSNTPGREEVRRTVQALVTTTVGTTVLQSITDYLVVGATVKLVRGESAEGAVGPSSSREALERAGHIARRTSTTGDVDLGLMVTTGHVRAGLVARNLTTPSFETDDAGHEAQLDRQIRAGAGWGSGWPGNARVIVGVDADVTRRHFLDGDRRDVAIGVETWWLKRRLGVRGGARGSTLGEHRPVVSSGLSAGIANGIFLEAQAAAGAADQRSWSVGARITF